MTYYIYHIAGIKIGVTNNIERRMSEQGFTDWDILEEHTDINLVSIREKELQKEYGYPVDIDLYSNSARKGRKYFTKQESIRGGSIGGARTRDLGHLDKARTFESCSKGGINMRGHRYNKVTCPHCNKEGGGGNMKRFHFDNCKLA